MEFDIRTLLSIFAVLKIVYDNKGRIYDKLNHTKAGSYIVLPFVLPYVIYGLVKLARDKDFMMRMLEAKKQKKLDDYM